MLRERINLGNLLIAASVPFIAASGYLFVKTEQFDGNDRSDNLSHASRLLDTQASTDNEAVLSIDQTIDVLAEEESINDLLRQIKARILVSPSQNLSPVAQTEVQLIQQGLERESEESRQTNYAFVGAGITGMLGAIAFALGISNIAFKTLNKRLERRSA